MFTQKIACVALFCYFREIRLHGIEKVPSNKAVMFLANHQNALLDPLVIAAFTPFRSYFLTRADIFVNPLVKQIFNFLRMLPVYRIRDGRDTLAKNEVIFDECTQLLQAGKTIFIFPEANHNIMRRVRPLSKGFTRIIFTALEKDPDLEVLLVPVGINYEQADGFPDRVAFYFDEPISSRDNYNPSELAASVSGLKELVSNGLKRSTTHIEDLTEYERIHNFLVGKGVDFQNPEESNTLIKEFLRNPVEQDRPKQSVYELLLTAIFLTINAPIVFFWRWVLKPKIQEVEFISTFRFCYVSVVQPLFYLTLWILLNSYFGAFPATLVVLLHFAFNLFFVKLSKAKL
ncbi:MAG: lysophospholipid acyltransferase family protein [Muriicola sp.]|nr:lysophospholipid acyltransferase family protein [Muriicola sp.]